MQIAVRIAGDADAEAVESHRRAALLEATSYRGHLDPTASPSGSSAVVLVDGSVVGSAGYSDHDDVRHITHLFVMKECREVGAGDALMVWLVNGAQEAGLLAVRASALPGDRSTKNLFERHGLVARATQVERKLR